VQRRGFRRRALGIHGLAPIVDALVKERLTGAIILVALIVLLVPELLHGPIRPASRARGPAAVTEEPPLRAYTINLADETHGGSVALQPEAPTPVAAAVEPPASTPPPAVPPSASPAQSPPVPTVVSPTQHPAPQAAAATLSDTPPPSKPSTSGKGGWVVQLGSFASAANAERLAQQVRKGGFPVGVSRAATGRRLYRVQVGPVHDHASAEQIAGRLRTLGHSGSIVPK